MSDDTFIAGIHGKAGGFFDFLRQKKSDSSLQRSSSTQIQPALELELTPEAEARAREDRQQRRAERDLRRAAQLAAPPPAREMLRKSDELMLEIRGLTDPS